MKYLKLLRVHHCIKNLLIYAALFFSGQFGDGVRLFRLSVAFISFCLMSSCVYVINDICDRKKDRKHPVKRERPIASGAISVKNAVSVAVLLAVMSLLINSLIFDRKSLALLLLYLLSNLGYSLGLKNVPLVDMIILASGFWMRLVYGAVIAGIVLSGWLYLTVLVIAFFFGMGKRRNELRSNNASEMREVLKKYPLEFLSKSMYMFLAMALVFYAMWSADAVTVAMHRTDRFIYTVPLVIIIAMRYCLDIENHSDGDPVEVVFNDPCLLVLCILYIGLVTYIIYS